MKVLIFSDLHLHNWANAPEVDGMNSRLRDQARVMDQVALYCEHNTVDHIVFGGDLFHTHGKIHESILKVASEGIQNILELSQVNIRILVGNHDTSNKNVAVHSLHWLNAIEGVKVIDDITHDKLYKEFSYLPYTEDKDKIIEFFEYANPICFMHQGIAGVPMGSGFLIDEVLSLDMIPDHVDQVFTGHYHKHSNPSDKVTVIGSALQLNWADMGDKRGFLVYDTQTGEVEHIESVAPKFVTLNMDGRGSADYVYQERLGKPGLFDGNFVRVNNYNSTYTDEIREGLMEAGARSVEFVPPKTEDTKLQHTVTHGVINVTAAVYEYAKAEGVTPECLKIGEELMK
jgi:DNA repair exonuclease SbcCD nuclease subunit